MSDPLDLENAKASLARSTARTNSPQSEPMSRARRPAPARAMPRRTSHVKLLDGRTDARLLLARGSPHRRRHRPRHLHSRRACLPAPASCTACLLPETSAHVRVVPARVRSCVPVPLSGTVLSRVLQEVQASQQWRFSSPRADSSPWISRCDASILCSKPSADHPLHPRAKFTHSANPPHDVSPWLLMSHTLSGTVLSCPSKKLTPNQY